MRRLKLTLIVCTSFLLVGCTTPLFNTQPSSAANLCTPPTGNNKTFLEQVRTTLIANDDIDAAQNMIEQHVNHIPCESNTTVYASFAYSGALEGPDIANGIACMSISVIEKRWRRPRFEQWSTCNTTATLKYWNDFNNIVTKNREMDMSLRYAGDKQADMSYVKDFEGALQQTLRIRSFGDFLDQGVFFDIEDPSAEVVIQHSMSIDN